MKIHGYLLLVLMFFMSAVLAQAPQKMSYQAVIRNNSGSLLKESDIESTISILQYSTTGTPVYIETHSVSTNSNGLATFEIGQGTVVVGSLNAINWADGPYFLKTETTGSVLPTIIGASELMSVPYALYSDNTAKIQGRPVSSDAPISGFVLKWDGLAWIPAADEIGTGAIYTAGTGISLSGNTISNTLPDVPVSITGGGITTVGGAYPSFTITTPASLDNDPANELQTIGLSGTTLTLSNGGGSVTLPTGTTYTAGTGISLSGNTISNTLPDVPVSITGGGITTVGGAYPSFTITTPASLDNDPANELQTIGLSGTTLTLSNGGGSVTLPTGTTYTAGTGISLSGNTISNTLPDVPVSITGGGITTVGGAYPSFTITTPASLDNDPANELQTIGLSGTTLTLSNGGGSVTLPTGTTYTAGTGISISGNTISNTLPDVPVSITGGGITTVGGAYPSFTITTPASLDNDPANELQTIGLSGTTLTLSNGGGSVTLPTGTTYTAGTGIGISGNVITNTGDADNNPTNELQTLSLSGTTLTLSNGGGSVTLPTGSEGWLLTGNAATASDFLGTINTQALRLRVNNTNAGSIHPTNFNTAIGLNALGNNTTGIGNTALGESTLPFNTTGRSNVAVGTRALRGNTVGNNSVAVGDSALFNNTLNITVPPPFGYLYGGSNNTAVGSKALFNNASLPDNGQGFIGGEANTAIGMQAMFTNVSGNDNTAVGRSALFSNVDGSDNIAVGSWALYANTNGYSNIAIGLNAMNSNTAGVGNVAIGHSAMGTTVAKGMNTAIGYQAMFNANSTTAAANTYNTAIGAEALRGSISSSANTGTQNTAVGALALYSNSSGGRNTAIGKEALRANTTGNFNTAIGSFGLYANTTGIDNVALGDDALGNNTTGNQNVGLGSLTLTNNTNGANNTAIGWGANTSGTAGNPSNATALGASAIANNSNKVRIGNTAVTTVEGAVVYTTSDARFKHRITEEVYGLDFIMRLRPVVYNYKAKEHQQFLLQNTPDTIRNRIMESINFTPAETIRQSGFIAQEVELAAKAAGYDFNGIHIPENESDYYSLSYQQFVVPLVKAMQEQQTTIIQLQAENIGQNKIITQLQAELQQIKSLLLQYQK